MFNDNEKCGSYFNSNQAQLREQKAKERIAIEKPLVAKKAKESIEKIANNIAVPQITLNYNYLCNFQCEHCCSDLFMNKTSKAEKADIRRKMTPEDVKMLADQADEIGSYSVTLSGGEPLVWKDLKNVITAIGPERFHIGIDTNAWFLSEDKAKELKSLGLDKFQISLDSFVEEEHDEFRKKKGSYQKVIKGVENAVNAGLRVMVMTCITKSRAYSQEFKDMLEWGKKTNVPIYVTLAKPIGAWAGHTEELCGNKEIDYIQKLSNEYDIQTRSAHVNGVDLGCIAVKRSITVTRYGDVMPCPYIHVPMGNIFKKSLNDIINHGLKLKHFSFGEKRTCLAGNKDEYFVKEYMPKLWGHKDIAPFEKVFDEKDYIEL